MALASSDPLYYFDCYTTFDEVEFYDSYHTHQDVFLPCFDSFDQHSDLFYNRYRDTCMETYYDVLPSYITFKQFVCSHLSQIDVLQHYYMINSTLQSMPSSYSRLPSDCTQFHHILLQARGLKARFFHYDDQLTIPLKDPMVYTSSNAEELPIVIDTGASCSITPTIKDFDGKLQKSSISGLNQVTGTASIVGQGNITWTIEDLEGTVRDIRTSAYYVPSASIRLFSPQVYIKDNNKASLILDHAGARFTLRCGTILKFPMNPQSNLPFMLTKAAITNHRLRNRCSHFLAFHLSNTLFQAPLMQFNTGRGPSVFNSLTTRSVLRRDNFNLHPHQQELLLWHCRLGHPDFQRVQALLGSPIQLKGSSERGEVLSSIITPSLKGASSCKAPRCEACQYAKQKRTTPLNPKHPSSDYKEGALTSNQLQPGDRVSCDQYMSTTLGRLPHTQGKEDKARQLVGGTMFVDHATNYIYHCHQINLTAAESVHSKHACERHFRDLGAPIRHYSSDNHPFTSKVWVDDCSLQGQDRTLSGVGAHHQNYMERHIQTIFNWARASMLHFVLHWPQEARETLWPFAVDHSVYLWNNLPARQLRLSPKELFTDSIFHNHNHLQRTHVFGCPVFVLDPKLQDSKKLPKWSMRSRRGIYLGVSPFHSSTVHLVLNPSTGSITPQYHVVFDDSFSTIFSNGQFDESKWQSLLSSGHELDSVLSPDSNGDILIPPDATTFDATTTTTEHPPEPSSLPLPPSNPSDAISLPLPSPPIVPLSSTEGAPPSSHEGAPLSLPEGARPSSPSPAPIPEPRRSTRLTRGQAPSRLTMLASYYNDNHISPCFVPGSTQTSFDSSNTNNAPKVPGEQIQNAKMASIKWNTLLETCTSKLGCLGSFMVEHQQSLCRETIDSYPLLDYLNPAILSVLAEQSDTPTFLEAMNGPNAAGFFKAMETEIDTLISMDTFVVMSREPWMKVISSTWAFKVKRYPDGSIRKLKARLCARGYEQVEGQDYFETFAPVVQWLTVRLILIMTILLGLENKQIDYTAAFVQAPIDTDVYVEMPKLFTKSGKVWKLKKSIYGLKQSPRNYFLHMKSKLEKLGFRQSIADPCLFISSTVICLIYVDDALLVYRDPASVDRLTSRMKDEDMLFNVESDVAGYLGVLIDRHKDGSIVMRQEGLTKRIVKALFLDDNKITSLRTPATSYLPIDEDGEMPLGRYNYASVVGMLNYLQGHSRIDIGFAVSQVARYVHSPRRSHELALERIGRYLKGTVDKGLILRTVELDDQFRIDVYVDAAFACGWGTELGTNPDSVKSRTGYIIEAMGCSVIWCSKLQSTIATSTMESEYTALSMSLRAAIPMMAVCTAINEGLNVSSHKLLTFRATVHEDNMGALILANLEPGRHTPRSKFYALRLHWFRSWLKPRQIELIHCPTKDQKADYLTKPLTASMYEANRFLSMGW